MTSSPRFRRFAFAFGSAFAILYLIALKLDLALFTVYPSMGVVLLGTHHSRDTVGPSMGGFLPSMYWYGWASTAASGALIFGLGATLLPERWSRPFWLGCVGATRGSDDRVRLSHAALVSTLVTCPFPSCS